MAVLLEGKPGRGRHHLRRNRSHRADAGSVLAADQRGPLARLAGISAVVPIRTEAGSWRLVNELSRQAHQVHQIGDLCARWFSKISFRAKSADNAERTKTSS